MLYKINVYKVRSHSDLQELTIQWHTIVAKAKFTLHQDDFASLSFSLGK